MAIRHCRVLFCPFWRWRIKMPRIWELHSFCCATWKKKQKPNPTQLNQPTQQNSRNPLFSARGAPATVKDIFAESLILIVLSNFEWSLEWSNPSSWQCSKVPVLVIASKGTELLWFLTVSPSPWSSMLWSGMGLLRCLFSPKSHVQLNYS